MIKQGIIDVNGKELAFFSEGGEDFLSLTDISKTQLNARIEKWLSNKNTIDFLGAWESLHNPNFNRKRYIELSSEAGGNAFTMSVGRWKEETNAIGLTAKRGVLGGTYAHKDIAFEFASWLSPEFKLLIIKEYQRLKENEEHRLGEVRDIKRLVTKANFRITTDAIKENLIRPNYDKKTQGIIYASEADVINIAVFGITASDWVKNNPQKAKLGNMRETADVIDLTILSNIEVLNAHLISQGLKQNERLDILIKEVDKQRKSFGSLKSINMLRKKSGENEDIILN